MISTIRRSLLYALTALGAASAFTLVRPVGAENATTVDPSTQPALKSWSNVIPNAKRRFVVLADFNNEAVLDRETGLVWQRSPDGGRHDWFFGRVQCFRDTVVGGKRGWRLPTIEELTSLLVESVNGSPTLQDGHPFLNVDTAPFYWSATRRDDGILEVWAVTFDPQVDYQVHFADMHATGGGLSWCVRGGQGTTGQ